MRTYIFFNFPINGFINYQVYRIKFEKEFNRLPFQHSYRHRGSSFNVYSHTQANEDHKCPCHTWRKLQSQDEQD